MQILKISIVTQEKLTTRNFNVNNYRGSFNNAKVKPPPKRKHVVADYNAHEDHVVCTCGFDGTAQGFETHNVDHVDNYHHITKHSTYTRLLHDIRLARADYYNQGSTGFYAIENDGYW